MALSLKIYSAYYLSYPIMPKLGHIVPIQAGAAIHPKLPMIGDDTGKNISAKNDLYSELTAAYWILHNEPRDTEAWGLCHYRRYLVPIVKKYFFKVKSRTYNKVSQGLLDNVLTEEWFGFLQNELAAHDVLIQRPTYAKKDGPKVYTIKDAYYADHIPEHWEVLMQVVCEQTPEFSTSIIPFGELTTMCFNNIMIARWDLWERYLKWLFDILFEVEKRIELPGEGYQRRVFGFMAERLHNLFIYHHQYKAGHLTLAHFQ
jgi:hypothetical protein